MLLPVIFYLIRIIIFCRILTFIIINKLKFVTHLFFTSHFLLLPLFYGIPYYILCKYFYDTFENKKSISKLSIIIAFFDDIVLGYSITIFTFFLEFGSNIISFSNFVPSSFIMLYSILLHIVSSLHFGILLIISNIFADFVPLFTI